MEEFTRDLLAAFGVVAILVVLAYYIARMRSFFKKLTISIRRVDVLNIPLGYPGRLDVKDIRNNTFRIEQLEKQIEKLKKTKSKKRK